MNRSLLTLALLILVATASAQIPAPTDAPFPRSPAESAASFALPDGFRMELVASEPLISAPSGICWDARGRMFISELHGYNLEGQLDIEDLNKTGKLDTQVRRVEAEEKFKIASKAGTFGVVKLLRDRDGDGRMDSADIWARDLPPAYGLVPTRDGVIVACAPDIIFLADRDGDGHAEVREVLFTGFRTGAIERGVNAPRWGADGWIYFGRGWSGGTITGPKLAHPVILADADFRIRADGSAIEPVTGGTRTFGFAFTESGDRFVSTTSMPGIFVAPLPWRYLVRNPAAATSSLDAGAGDRHAFARSAPHPWRRRRADDAEFFKFYRERYGPSESEAAGWFTGACGAFVYRDHVLPGLHGQYFVCEPAGNFIHRSLIEPDGSALQLRRPAGEEQSEFAASDDSWSHPIFLTHGPDGAIWVADYYREIIEDYSAIPRHLQQIYGLAAGKDRGRIYRLTHREAVAAPAGALATLTARELAREISSPLLWRRETAQRLLVERAAAEVAPALRAGLTAAAAPAALITVLRTLDGLGRLTPIDVRPLLTHADAAVRVHALQLGDRWLAAPVAPEMLAAVLAAAEAEGNPRVQIQFALSLGESRDPRAFAALVQFARERLAVRWMDTAVLSSVHGRGAALLAELLREPGTGEKLIVPLAQTVGASRDESELHRTLELTLAAAEPMQANLLGALLKGRANALRRPLADAATRAALATFAASNADDVRTAARALGETFAPATLSATETNEDARATVGPEVTEEIFKKFIAALDRPRDVRRGGQIFRASCAPCHRIGDEGHDFGPDLLGEIGVAEETLVRHIVLPSEHIRPGFETTQVDTQAGTQQLGILKAESATALTLLLPGGVEQVVLRQDVVQIRRVARSLMPSFADTLTPVECANLIAWLRGQLGAAKPP